MLQKQAGPEEGALFASVFDGAAQDHLAFRTVADEQGRRTLKPTVVVGLGGTGCAIAARLKRALRAQYRGLPDAIDMVRFVLFDTEPLEAQRDPLVRRMFTAGAEYQYLGGFAPEDLLRHQNDADLDRWWDRRYPAASVPVTEGCKRIRQLGRLCLYRSRVNASNALEAALDRARQLNVTAVRDLALPNLPDGTDMRFYLISGTCGGNGSGMFLDLCHMLYRTATEHGGIPSPMIHALLVMPTLYLKVARDMHPRLRHAFQANGYAFLRELQHFMQHGEEWHDQCMDALQRKEHRQARLPGGWRPASRVYLMDDLIAGRALSDLDDLYGLSADALFQMVTTPVANPGALANVDGQLTATKLGKATAFSSIGMSYLMYPAATLSRCAAAGYLRDILRTQFLRPLSDAERSEAQAAAQQLFAEMGDLVDARRVALALRHDADLLAASLPTADSILGDGPRHAGGRGTGLYGALEQAGRLADGLLQQAAATISTAADRNRAAWLDEIDSRLSDPTRIAVGRTSLYFAQQILTELALLVSQADPAADASGRTLTPGDAEELCRRNVQRLEGDWIPNRLQARALQTQVRTFANALGARYRMEIADRASDAARSHRGLAKGRVDDATATLTRAMQELGAVATALDAQAQYGSAMVSEEHLPATTQFVPAGGVGGAIETLTGELSAGAADDSAPLLTRLAEGTMLAALGAADADARSTARRAVFETLGRWAVDKKEIDRLLRMPLHEVAERSVGREAFTNTVLENLLRLADPTWELNLTRAGMNPEDTIQVYGVSIPREMPDELLPEALRDRRTADAPAPLDDRRIMVARFEHGAPLHAVVGIEVLRGEYGSWLADKDNERDPLHISREWNAGRGLDEVVPDLAGAKPEELLYFALGSFTEWLVKEKKHAAVPGVIENLAEHGYLYTLSANQYNSVVLEKTPQGSLRRTGDRKLYEGTGGSRAAAAERFDRECVQSAALYMDRLNQVVAWDELKALLSEYLLVLQGRIDSTGSPDLRDQLTAERRSLTEYLQEK